MVFNWINGIAAKLAPSRLNRIKGLRPKSKTVKCCITGGAAMTARPGTNTPIPYNARMVERTLRRNDRDHAGCGQLLGGRVQRQKLLGELEHLQRPSALVRVARNPEGHAVVAYGDHVVT